MDQVRRVIAVALIVLAVAVGLNLMLTPVYHDGGETYPVWQVLNWFMAVAVVVALAVSVHRSLSGGGGPDDAVTREYLGATAMLLGSIGLVIIFYWNWLWTLFPDNEVGLAAQSHINHFPWMDVLFTWVAGSAGLYLWRAVGEKMSRD